MTQLPLNHIKCIGITKEAQEVKLQTQENIEQNPNTF